MMNVKHACGLLGAFLLSVSLLTGCGNTISAKTEKDGIFFGYQDLFKLQQEHVRAKL